MTAAADALQPARHRWRRFDLDHEIDRAHVDAELERRGGDQRTQRSRLEAILDLDALLAGDRTVMRADQRLSGQLVQRAGQPLGEAAAVDEDERGAMRANQVEQARMDRRPDRGTRIADRRGSAWNVVGGREPCHVFDRHFDPQVERLLGAGVHDRDRPECDRRVRRKLVFDRALGVSRRRRTFGGWIATAGVMRRAAPLRPGSEPLHRAGAASPRARCAAAADDSGPPAVRWRAPGARRAWSAPARESRR